MQTRDVPHTSIRLYLCRGDGKTEVRVHQLVKSLNGEVLSDMEVLHIYTIVNGLIERMIERMEVNAHDSAFRR